MDWKDETIVISSEEDSKDAMTAECLQHAQPITDIQTLTEELKEAAKPLREILDKYYNPMCEIRVSSYGIEIFCTELSLIELD